MAAHIRSNKQHTRTAAAQLRRRIQPWQPSTKVNNVIQTDRHRLALLMPLQTPPILPSFRPLSQRDDSYPPNGDWTGPQQQWDPMPYYSHRLGIFYYCGWVAVFSLMYNSCGGLRGFGVTGNQDMSVCLYMSLGVFSVAYFIPHPLSYIFLLIAICVNGQYDRGKR